MAEVQEFAKGGALQLVEYEECMPALESVERALLVLNGQTSELRLLHLGTGMVIHKRQVLLGEWEL